MTIFGAKHLNEAFPKLRIGRRVGEWAMQQRGKRSSSTCKEVVATINLFDSTNASEFRQGKVMLVIPSHAMHSFIAFNNKIQWFVCVHGEIAHWPNMQVEFPLIVRPRPLPSGRSA